MRLKHARVGFTLIELLIVIGLLGALASLVLSRLSVGRTEMLDASIVEKELLDIQRAFQRFAADCVPNQTDYKLMTQYGLEVLMDFNPDRGWKFPSQWDPAQGRGWRGPYIESEGEETVNIAAKDNGVAELAGQQDVGGTSIGTINVIYTPYVEDQDDQTGDYYRVIPNLSDRDSGRITQLWVVFPSHSGVLPSDPEDPNAYEHQRRLLLND